MRLKASDWSGRCQRISGERHLEMIQQSWDVWNSGIWDCGFSAFCFFIDSAGWDLGVLDLGVWDSHQSGASCPSRQMKLFCDTDLS